MAERTFFYALPALGLYSSRVECLRSYIERLALAHHRMPRDLIRLVLERAPLFGHSGSVVNITCQWRIHSASPMNAGLLSRFASATGQNLEGTSMARFGNAFSMHDLLTVNATDDIRFCPLCFKQDLEEGLDIPYGRLLWVVKAVNCCPLHGCHLQSTSGCWTGAGKRLAIQQRPRAIGVCPDCGSIGRLCSHSSISMASAHEVAIARMMGDVLAMSHDEGARCSPESIRLGVSSAIGLAFKGQYVPAAAAANLGRGTIHGWIQGTGTPALASLAQLAIACNVDLSWMLRGETLRMQTHIVASDLKRNFPRTYHRSSVTDAELERQMGEALLVSPAQSLAEVARKAGVCTKRLRQKHPALARAIVAANSEHIAQQRERTFSESVRAYETALLKLRNRGVVVTPIRLQKEAGLYDLHGGALRARALRRVLQSANFPA